MQRNRRPSPGARLGLWANKPGDEEAVIASHTRRIIEDATALCGAEAAA